MNRIQPYWLGAFFIAIVLLIYVGFKCYALDVTNDEAYSILLLDTFNWRALAGSANTHWLNALFTWLWLKIFGHNVALLRLHSFLAAVLYFGACLFSFRFAKNKLIMLAVPIILFCNYYLLDFFSLARGYGLCIGLLAVALYYFLSNNEKSTKRGFIFLGFSLLASYTIIYFALCISLFYLLQFNSEKNTFKRAILFAAAHRFFCGCLLLCLANIAAIQLLYHGYNEGQWNGYLQDTWGVYLQRSYNLCNENASQILGSLLMLLIACAALYARSKKNIAQEIIGKSLLLTALITIALRHLFHFPYPFGRVALYYNFVGILYILHVAASTSKKWVHSIIFSIAVVVLFSFVQRTKNKSQFFTTTEWYAQQGAKKLYENWTKEQQLLGSPYSIGISLDQWGVVNNYYQHFTPNPNLTFERYNINNFSTKDSTTISALMHCNECILPLNLPPSKILGSNAHQWQQLFDVPHMQYSHWKKTSQ